MNENKEEVTIEQKIKNKNILIDTSDLDKVAEFIEDFDPKKDKYKRTLEAQGYVAARRANTGSYSSIAKNLGLAYGEFKYYLETKPEFAAAIRKGIIDGKEELKTQLVETIVNKAMGMTLKEVKTEYGRQDDGSFVDYKKTEKEIVKLVDKVIEGKKNNIDTKELEEEINRVIGQKTAVGVGCMV